MKSFQAFFSESSAKPQNAFWARLINYTSFDHKAGKNIILSILVISYIEILAQSFNLVFQYIPNDQNDLSTTTQVIQRAFSFDDIFNYGYDDGILLLACCGILLYFLYLLVSFSMVVYSAYKFKKPPYMAQVVPILLLVHSLVLFYPIDNLCNRLHYESRANNLSQINLNFGRNAIMVVSLLIGVINFILAAIPTFLLYHILPSYNPLSSRNYYTDQITFLQKTVISAVIKLILTSSDLPGVLLTADLLFSLIRQAWYFYSCPRYQITTFKLEAYCLTITTLLPLLTLVIFIINQIIDDPLTTATLIIVFLVLCVMHVILLKSRLEQILRQILFRPVNALGPYRALYKLMFLKYLVRNTHSLNERMVKLDMSYFCLSTVSNRLKQLFSECNLSQNLTDLDTKEGRTQFKRMYLEHITTSFAKHDEFKFMLAELYAKNLRLHTLAIKILAKIRYGFSSFHVKASAKLLFLKIQEHIMNQEQNNEAKINLSEFVAIRNEQESLQSEIKKQLDLHVKVWQEYSHSSTNLSELQRLSQLIDTQKLHIKKQWARIENRDGKNLSRLCLLYGQYQIVLNHSVENGLKYIKKHSLLYRRFDPAHPLNSSNFVDSDNFSITFTTHQEKMGNIIHASESIQNALGYQKNLLIGSSIGNIMTPYISERHNEWISEYIRTGHRTFMGQLQTVLVKNALGTLKKVSLFANIHPSLDQEVCLIGLFRLLEDPLEYILVTPEGEIDSYTERIGLKLGLQRKHAHIENICRDYEEIVGPREVVAKEVVASPNSPESPEDEYFANADEKEGASPTTKEDFLLTSTNRHLLSSRTMTSPLVPQQGRNILFSQDTQTEYKESNKEHKKEPLDHDHNPKMLKMSFNTYSLVPNKSTQIFSYDCTVATMPLRSDYLRVLAIEMIDENKLKGRESVENISFDQKQEIDKNNTSKIRPTNNIHLHPVEALPNQVMSSSMSTGSTSQRRKATSTYLEEALNAKYYPKQIFTFLIVFAILISGTILIQGLFHAKTQAGLNKIYSLTITMNLASSRADTFSSLARHVRGAYYIRDQYLPPGLSVTNSTKSSFSAKLALLISTLSSTNSQLQSVIQGVDASFRKNFTDENIRMYDVNPDLTIGSYRTFNTFMATNVMISKISGLNKTYMTIPINDFHTIFHNSVNDLLISTINAVEVIYQEIQSFSENMEYTLKVYQILSMILVSMRFVISCYFFYWVYTSEVALGQKFLVITPKQVALILQKLHNLDKSIEREEFEQFDHTDIENNVPGTKAVNVRIDKNLKTSGLASQHWKRFLIYFILLLLLIGQTNFTFIHVTKGFENLNNQIDNLAKIEMSQYELTVLTCANSQVICNDFVTPIRNNDPIVELQADLMNLQTMIESLMAAFTDDKGIVDPIVAPFFFGDACSLMSTTALRTSCLSMTNGAKEFGLLSLLSRHYTLFTTSYHNFQISNKTFSQLQTLVVWSVTYLAPSLNVIRDLIITIMTRLNSNFGEDWNSTYHNAILVVSLNTCSLVIFWALVMSFVHLYFFNFYNRFKGMLKVIPFDIILSNSTLKGVMIISSRKKMDRIKNRI